MTEPPRAPPEQLLERLQSEPRPRLRIYIGAAPGVGKTYSMLQDAHGCAARVSTWSSG